MVLEGTRGHSLHYGDKECTDQELWAFSRSSGWLQLTVQHAATELASLVSVGLIESPKDRHKVDVTNLLGGEKSQRWFVMIEMVDFRLDLKKALFFSKPIIQWQLRPGNCNQ